MGRKAVQTPTAGGTTAAAAALPARSLTVDGKPEPWEDTEAGAEGPSSPSAKTSKEHRRQPGVVAAVRRALFPLQSSDRHALRPRAAAAAISATLLLLLLTAWAGKLRGGQAVLAEGAGAGAAAAAKAKVLWEQPKWVSRVAALHSDRVAHAAPGKQAVVPRLQASGGQQTGGSGSGAGAPVEALVEFTAPGLVLPLRDALNTSFPEQAAELTLLQLLPTTSSHPQGKAEQAAAARPTLEQVLRRYKELEEEEKPLAAGSGAGQGGSRDQQKPADVANAIQAVIQLQEGEAQRKRREKHWKAEEARAALGATTSATDPDPGSSQGEAQQAAGEPISGSSSDGGPRSREAGQLRMLVGVISACCSPEALQRRAAIRETWARTIREARAQPSVDLRFFLAQAPSNAASTSWLPTLQEEALAHNDTVVLRGKDKYLNLPNKTLRFLRYVLAHPAGYTHLLKVDDDTYVRIDRVLGALRDPLDEAGGSEGGAWALPAHRGDGTLPAMRQQLLEHAGRTGEPMHTDGIQLYNLTEVVAAAGAATGLIHVDDESGERRSLAELAQDAAEARKQLKARQAAAAAAKHLGGGGIVLAGGSGTAARAQHPAAAAAGGSGLEMQGGSPAVGPPRPPPPPRMTGVYMGCLENRGGYFPIRDKASKWFIGYDALPDSAVPFAIKYLAGWGLVLSRDMADHAVRSANLFLQQGDAAPAWFRSLPFEDVMLGMLLMDAVEAPQDHTSFRAAWRSCGTTTAVKHLDVDAPALLKGLHEQELSGLWSSKPVQCAGGDYLPGDYTGWKRWRDALPSVAHI
ncbi:hypothetical protein ABPG75_007358 [Micractinium tetrahymenae]